MKLYPCCSNRPPSPLGPVTNNLHSASLQASCPGLPAPSSKGQKELSGLIKTGQLTRPHLKTPHYLFRIPPWEEIGGGVRDREDVGRDKGDQWKRGV